MTRISKPMSTLAILTALVLPLGLLLPTPAAATGGSHPGGDCNADGGHAHVSINSPTWDEDDGTVVFTVTCNPCGNVNANFAWSVTGGTATEGVDYTISGLNMTIGQDSSEPQTRDITVTLIDDGGFEPNETIIIGGPNSVDNGNPSVLAPCLILDPETPIGTGTIQNDDPMNSPPTANAGGPYSAPEGGSVGLSGSGTDPDGDTLTYAWDLDNNGSFETAGQNPTFSAAGRDGPDTQTVVLRVSDGIASDTDSVVIGITNVAPSVGAVSESPDPSNEGVAVVASATYSDPGVPDTHTCTVDYGDGSGAQAGTAAGGTCTGPSHVYVDDNPTGTPSDVYTVTVVVTDDDGGSDSNTGSHTVNNVAPAVGTVAVSSEPSDEGEAVTGSASYTDAGAADTHTCTVDYGDGSGAQAGTAAGGTCTGPSHVYADDNPTGTPSDVYTVTVVVIDDDGGSDSNTGSHTVNNVAPSIDPVVLSSASIDEGQSVTVTGTYSDPALGVSTETFSGTADWSDGPSTSLAIFPDGTFETSRFFDDDHPVSGTSLDNFTVDITITDDDGGSDTETSGVLTVNNVDPSIDAIDLSASSLDEGDPIGVTVTGSFSDPALGVPTEIFTGAALWSDGESTPVSADSAAGTFETSRTFPDDHPMTGTPSDLFTVDITITDDDTGTDTDTSPELTVDNVDPTITATSNSAAECGDTPEGTPVDVTVDFFDPGFGSTEDWADSTIDWGDGFSEPATVVVTPGAFGTPTTGTASGTHVYATGGIFTITVTVVDDDTGSDSAIETALVTGAGLTPAGLLGVVGTDDLDVVGIQEKFKTDMVVTAGFLGPGKASFPIADVVSVEVRVCDGNDQVHLNKDIMVPAVLVGGPGPDHLRGGSGYSLIEGGPGNDHLFAGNNGATLDGGAGDDDLNGSENNDVLLGGEGDDKLAGDKGDDMLDGGPGFDDCNPGKGTDVVVNCEQ